MGCLQSIGWRVTSFGLALCITFHDWMGSESNNNHSDNLWSIISGIIYLTTSVPAASPMQKCLQVQTIQTYLTLTYLQCIQCWSLSSSHCTGWLLFCCLSSPHRLVLSSHRTLVLSSSSHCAAFSVSNRAGCLLRCLLSRCRLFLLSSSQYATL